MSPTTPLNSSLVSTLVKHKTGFSLAVYAVVCAAFFPSLRYMSGGDTLNYISIAELYASGQWSAAVSAFWSPAFSLLLAPFIAVGIKGIVAVKIANILIGALVLVALSSFGKALDLEDDWTALLMIAAVPFVASSVFLNSTPDVLVVLVLSVYVRCLLQFRRTNQIGTGVLVGVIGFFGYLSKYYLFPFFLLHYTGTTLLRYVTRSSKGPDWKGFAIGWGCSCCSVRPGSSRSTPNMGSTPTR